MMTFHHLEKFSLHSHPSRCCYGCIDHMRHRLFTASVSHGGHFFLLLPSCVLRLIFEEENMCSFFLRAFFTDTGYCAVAPHGVLVCFAPKNGILCILYGVGLICNMSSVFGSVEADLFPNGSILLHCFACSDHFSRTWRMGCCRRRWMNEYTCAFLTWV